MAEGGGPVAGGQQRGERHDILAEIGFKLRPQRSSDNALRLAHMRQELYARADWMANGVSEPPERISYRKQHSLKMDEIEAHAGLFAVCLCMFGQSNITGLPTFHLSDDGEPSAIIEALDADGKTILDLIAWPLRAPLEFATALGNMELLGAFNILGKISSPLMMHWTPLSWIKADCKGCVVLNPEHAGHWIQKYCRTKVVAEDLEHARWLVESGIVHEDQMLVPASSARRAA